MINRYRCDNCDCYLDPGEGMMCDECRDMLRKRTKQTEVMSMLVAETAGGQYEMNLQEALCILE